jgi:hypothetical protein
VRRQLPSPRSCAARATGSAAPSAPPLLRRPLLPPSARPRPPPTAYRATSTATARHFVTPHRTRCPQHPPTFTQWGEPVQNPHREGRNRRFQCPKHVRTPHSMKPGNGFSPLDEAQRRKLPGRRSHPDISRHHPTIRDASPRTLPVASTHLRPVGRNRAKPSSRGEKSTVSVPETRQNSPLDEARQRFLPTR